MFTESGHSFRNPPNLVELNTSLQGTLLGMNWHFLMEKMFLAKISMQL